jgi:hypothetical protein
MQKKAAKFLALLLVACMLVIGAAGCHKSETQSSTSNTVYKTAETITVYDESASVEGTQAGWFGKILKDKFNITLNVIATALEGGQTKYQTMAASGNMGDLVIFSNNGNNFTNSIKAGLLLDMGKDNLIANHAKDISKTYPGAIERMKTSFGNNTAVYGLPTRVSQESPTLSQNATEVNSGLMLRYDTYMKAGSPKITSFDDFVSTLIAMHTAQPKSESGKPTYAYTMFADNDDIGLGSVKDFESMFGYSNFGPLFVSNMGDSYQSEIDPSSYYMQGLRALNKLNQVGLIDPDSISQKGTDAGNKYTDGQILFSFWYYQAKNSFNTVANLSASKGYAMVPFEGQKISSPGFTPNGDNGSVVCFGKNCQDPARMMDLINWLYTPEGNMTTYNGPQGLTWEVKNGKPAMTDFGRTALPAVKIPVDPKWGGSTFGDGLSMLNVYTVSNAEINLDYGVPYKYACWPTSGGTDPLNQAWTKAMGGATYTKQYLQDHNQLAVIPGNSFNTPTLSSDLQHTLSQVGQIICQYSWKMVFAKSDAEFAQYQNTMISQANSLGYNTLLNYYVSLVPKIRQARQDAVASVAAKTTSSSK